MSSSQRVLRQMARRETGMSTKSFFLMMFMWVALILISMDLIETGHWLIAVVLDLIALVMTFFVVD